MGIHARKIEIRQDEQNGKKSKYGLLTFDLKGQSLTFYLKGQMTILPLD